MQIDRKQGQAGQQKLNLQEINDIGRFSYSINLVAFLHTTSSIILFLLQTKLTKQNILKSNRISSAINPRVSVRRETRANQELIYASARFSVF